MRRVLKQLLVLVVIMAASINSFAAVVGDYDGSAFITKNEFEELKHEFAGQVKNYEDSINAKVDGAIANYLDGINVAKKEKIKTNISIISYPLTIINALDKMKKLDNPQNNQTEPFYSPGYSLYGFIHRGYDTNGRTGIALLEVKASRAWQKWLHGNWNSGVSKFIVDGMSDALDYTFSGATYHDGDHVVNDLEAFFLSLDYYNATSQVSGQTSGTTRSTGSSNRLLNDYENFTNTDGALKCVFSPGIFAGVSGATTSCRFNYGSTDSLDTWKFTGAANVWYNRVKCLDSLRTYSYNPIKTDALTEIYNCGLVYIDGDPDYGNEEYKKYLAPVTMGDNQTIYLTNLKKYRRVMNNSDTTKSGWWIRYTKQSTTGFTFTGVITTGYNIESEYSTSPRTGTNAHPVDKRSAVIQQYLYYNFKNSSGDTVEHHMVDGVPLESFEKTFGTKIDNVKITLNIESSSTSYATNRKYIVFATKPITEQKYTDDVENKEDYIKIKKVNGTSVGGAKKVQLAEGNNVIEFEEDMIKGGDILYYKLLWNDASDGYVRITKTPEIEAEIYR